MPEQPQQPQQQQQVHDDGRPAPRHHSTDDVSSVSYHTAKPAVKPIARIPGNFNEPWEIYFDPNYTFFGGTLLDHQKKKHQMDMLHAMSIHGKYLHSHAPPSSNAIQSTTTTNAASSSTSAPGGPPSMEPTLPVQLMQQVHQQYCRDSLEKMHETDVEEWHTPSTASPMHKVPAQSTAQDALDAIEGDLERKTSKDASSQDSELMPAPQKTMTARERHVRLKLLKLIRTSALEDNLSSPFALSELDTTSMASSAGGNRSATTPNSARSGSGQKRALTLSFSPLRSLSMRRKSNHNDTNNAKNAKSHTLATLANNNNHHHRWHEKAEALKRHCQVSTSEVDLFSQVYDEEKNSSYFTEEIPQGALLDGQRVSSANGRSNSSSNNSSSNDHVCASAGSASLEAKSSTNGKGPARKRSLTKCRLSFLYFVCGFLFPPLWIIGAMYTPPDKRRQSPSGRRIDRMWKRCSRMALVSFSLGMVIILIAVLAFKPEALGWRKSWNDQNSAELYVPLHPTRGHGGRHAPPPSHGAQPSPPQRHPSQGPPSSPPPPQGKDGKDAPPPPPNAAPTPAPPPKDQPAPQKGQPPPEKEKPRGQKPKEPPKPPKDEPKPPKDQPAPPPPPPPPPQAPKNEPPLAAKPSKDEPQKPAPQQPPPATNNPPPKQEPKPKVDTPPPGTQAQEKPAAAVPPEKPKQADAMPKIPPAAVTAAVKPP
ncbi:hypothetical protein BC940DRAFT_328598 [Gongronella butleri]|nr:hypothetical protein BC940DRAFT_328598 [Gongronella butleri]